MRGRRSTATSPPTRRATSSVGPMMVESRSADHPRLAGMAAQHGRTPTGRSHLPTRAASVTASDRSCPPRWISARSRWTQFAECLHEHGKSAVRLLWHYPGRQYRRNITGLRSSTSYRNSPLPCKGIHESQEDELTTQRRTAHAFRPRHTVATAAVRRPDGAGARGPTLRPGPWSGSPTRRCGSCLRTSLGGGTVHARPRSRGLRAPLR